MVPTYGLTHINLAVRDTERALRFYEQVFGLREYGRGDGLVHTQAAGRHDILTFAEDPSTAGAVGGVAHFGFRLVDPNDIDRAITGVERAGGRLLRRGEFAPGLPYAYVDLADTNAHNGALRVLPGSHLKSAPIHAIPS